MMKKAVTLCALLLSLPLVSHAGVELGVDVPGLSLHIGDQDRRGYYWDGDDWRDPHWWHHHHRHHEDGRWVWVEEPDEDVPPPRWHEPPPPPRWHDDWHDGPPLHWHHHDRDDW